MGTCVFNAADIKRSVLHALNSNNWDMPFMEDETPTPALLFVHDNGVYVMSNGIPRDVSDNDAERSYTVHAATTNPAENDEWWQNASDLVGGDDFVEILPVTRQWLEDCDHFEEFFVTINDNTLEAGFRKRRPLPERRKLEAVA